MPDLYAERRHLTDADQSIADGHRRVSAQLALINRLVDLGADIAEAVLFLIQQSLEQLRQQRLLILSTIDAIPHFGL